MIGALVRWRYARTAAQLGLLVVALTIVLHGLFGPPVAPANLATVITWVHYRGLLVIGLLAVGNLFCTGCPFVLVRDAGRRVHQPTRSWPRRLRTKWIGIALFVAALFTYELYDLWALPAATAFLVLGYFGAALAIDLVFKGATFCKHVCPIGQFNFIAAPMSPLEVRTREASVCSSCRTFDCIRGRHSELPAARVAADADHGAAGHIVPAAALRMAPPQRGCELRLFLPSKVGNVDCTFCLDCVHACPHDNVAIAPRIPGAELLDDRRRSGIGRLSARADLAALAIVFVFAGLLNAFAMSAPARSVQQTLAGVLGTTSEWPALAALFALALLVLPVLLIGAAAAATRRIAANATRSVSDIAVRYAYALVPLGFGVWLAHYGFHFLTGALTIVPVAQSAVADLAGWPALGEPLWRWVGMQPGAVFPIQAGVVLLGAVGSLALAAGISERDYANRATAAALPWAAVTLLLAAATLWTLAQPMDMRGTIIAG